MGSGEGGGVTCAKVVLALFNIPVVLIGVLALAVGIIAKNPSLILDQQVIKDLLDQVAQAAGGITFDTDGLKDLLNTFLTPMATPLIIIGTVVLVIGLLGLCGACCPNKCLLGLYCVILILIIIGEIVLLIISSQGIILEEVEEIMTKELQDEYDSFMSNSTTSVFFSFLMIQFKCCGVNNFTDFQNAAKWKSTQTFANPSNPSQMVTVNLKAPLACCKFDDNFDPVDEDCFKGTMDDTNANLNTGCIDALLKVIDPYYLYIYLGTGGIFLLEIIPLIMAIVVARNKSKDDD